MRAFFLMPIAMLAMLAVAPRPAAATAITYDFSGTLRLNPVPGSTDTAVTGQFTIDFDSQTITAFDFQTPIGAVDASHYTPHLYVYAPAYSPADNFVRLYFEDGPANDFLGLIFRTTLSAFDGSTFYTLAMMPTEFTGTSSGFGCGPASGCPGFLATNFTSGAATPHPDPPPAVPEPTSLALLGGGLATLVARRHGRGRLSLRLRVLKTLTAGAAVRATAALTVLALVALAPRPAAASVITEDFSATLDHGPTGDLGNTAITGQFTIDVDTATITAFDFVTPGGGQVDATHGYITYLFTYTPAVNPADNFVQLVFENGDSGSTLVLLFRTTLAAFDGHTFYTGLVDIDGGGTGSGFECRYTGCGPQFGSPFVSGAATPHTDPPPPTVPEPTSLALVAGGLVTLAGRLRAGGRDSDRGR